MATSSGFVKAAAYISFPVDAAAATDRTPPIDVAAATKAAKAGSGHKPWAVWAVYTRDTKTRQAKTADVHFSFASRDEAQAFVEWTKLGYDNKLRAALKLPDDCAPASLVAFPRPQQQETALAYMTANDTLIGGCGRDGDKKRRIYVVYQAPADVTRRLAEDFATRLKTLGGAVRSGAAFDVTVMAGRPVQSRSSPSSGAVTREKVQRAAIEAYASIIVPQYGSAAIANNVFSTPLITGAVRVLEPGAHVPVDEQRFLLATSAAGDAKDADVVAIIGPADAEFDRVSVHLRARGNVCKHMTLFIDEALLAVVLACMTPSALADIDAMNDATPTTRLEAFLELAGCAHADADQRAELMRSFAPCLRWATVVQRARAADPEIPRAAFLRSIHT